MTLYLFAIRKPFGHNFLSAFNGSQKNARSEGYRYRKTLKESVEVYQGTSLRRENYIGTVDFYYDYSTKHDEPAWRDRNNRKYVLNKDGSLGKKV